MEDERYGIDSTESSTLSVSPNQIFAQSKNDDSVLVQKQENNLNYNKPWRLVIRRKISDG